MAASMRASAIVLSAFFFFCVSPAHAALPRSVSELMAFRQARHAAEQLRVFSPRPAETEFTTRLALPGNIAADIPVAVDDRPSRLAQRYPISLSGGGDGGLILFLDERNGPFGLWGTAVSASAVPQGGNVLIKAASGLGGIGVPAAVRQSSTSLLVAYPDADLGGIFVLPVGNDLAPLSAAHRVSPDDGRADRPDIAATATGAVVVWEDYRSGSHIYARLIDGSGAPVGTEFKVNVAATTASRWVPKAAAGDGDTILVIWEDYRSGEPDVYYRVFTGAGAPITGDMIATSSGSASPQYQPDVVYGRNFGFLVTWIDVRGGMPAVYGRMIKPNGIPVAEEFVFANPADTAEFWDPALASDGNAQAVVTYESIAQRTVITAQRFFPDAPFGPAFTISDVTADSDRFRPSPTYRHDGGMLFSWMDYRTANLDVRARSFMADAAPAGNEQKLNDDLIGNQQRVGDGVRTNSSLVYAAYAEESRDEGDIFVQRISSAGQLVGDRVQVNDDITPARQAEPAIAASGDGTLFVAWTDARSTYTKAEYDIYFQVLPGGIKAGHTNLRLSDDTDADVQIQPDIAVFPGGGAITVWTDYRLGGAAAIFGQIINESFAREGANFPVGATFPRPDDTPPKVATFNLENSAIGWRSDSSGQGTIWIQPYNRTVGPLGNAFRLPIDSADYSPAEFEMLTLPDDGFGVCWRGQASGHSAIFFQRFSKFFLRVGSNVRISEGGAIMPRRVSVDGDFAGYSVFAWTENVAGKPTAVRRIFDPFGAPIGPVEAVSDDAGNSFSFDPIAIATGRYAAVLYTDNRIPGKGFDVRADFYLYSATNVLDQEDDAGVPDRMMLQQNFPNPFNPSTVINFSVPTAGQYQLAVYDILGRSVRILWDGYRMAGSSSITWNGTTDDGSPVPSGIYFYRLRGMSFTTTRKMTLVK